MSGKGKTARLILCCATGGLLLWQPQAAAQGFESGIQLCLRTVLPALFPFFVLCDWMMGFVGDGRALRPAARFLGMRNASGVLAILLSWLGGYAVAARLAGQLRREGTLSARDASLVMLLGCCSSPGFVIGCVGGLLLGNLALGVLLYGLQLSANLLSTALCLPLLPVASSAPQGACLIPQKNSFSGALGRAVDSSLQVCGCVLFFRTVAAAVLPFLPEQPLVQPLLSGLLEITAGCADFARLGGKPALYGICFCLSTLGLSVWAQLSMLLQGAVSCKLLAWNRAIHLVIFVLLVRLCTPFLPAECAVYSTLATRVIPMYRLPWDAAVVVFCFLCAALYKVRQNFYNK